MDVIIAAVGRLKTGPEAELLETYTNRGMMIGRNMGLIGPKVIEVEAPKSMQGAVRQAKEAELLTEILPIGAQLFVMDEHGKAFTSPQFANHLEQAKDNSIPATVFLIGGADGHGPMVRDLLKSGKARAVSLGPATWPHLLVRVMLAEQLYRAMTILAGHPYHRS